MHLNNIKYFILFVLLIFCSDSLFSQGCSDAGFCSMSDFKPSESDSVENTQKNRFKSGLSSGKADNQINATSFYLEYSRAISKNVGLECKISGSHLDGRETTVAGVSDFYINTTVKINSKIKASGGLKYPLNQGNLSKNGSVLPMDYQTSLGTFDAIAGISFELNKLHFVVAVQQPLVQNKNKFIAGADTLFSTDKFLSTNKFSRSGDVLLRVSYPVQIFRKWKVTPSVLPIYHLKNDRFTDPAANKVTEITGSEGLTLNGNIFLDYQINQKTIIQLIAGKPFIVREERPDGLTRSWVAEISFSTRF